jgi:hypothetical protein
LAFIVSLSGIPAIIYANKAKDNTEQLLSLINFDTNIFDNIQISYEVVIAVSMGMAFFTAFYIAFTRSKNFLGFIMCFFDWFILVCDVVLCMLFAGWLVQLMNVEFVSNKTLGIYDQNYMTVNNVSQGIDYAVGNVTNVVDKIQPYIQNISVPILNTEFDKLTSYLDKINNYTQDSSICPPYCLNLSVVGEIVIQKRCICAVDTIVNINNIAHEAHKNLIVATALTFILFISLSWELMCVVSRYYYFKGKQRSVNTDQMV